MGLPPPQRKRKTPFIDNNLLIKLLGEYRADFIEKRAKGERARMGRELGKAIMDIAENLSKHPSFSRYSYKEEMILDAVENCFHRSTKIATLEHGTVAIGDIVGQTVTVRARDGEWRQAKVKSYGRKMLYEYGFASFNQKASSTRHKVIATADHRWYLNSRRETSGLLNRESTLVDDLRIGDCLEQMTFIDPIDDEAVLHGLIFGDGTGEKTVQVGASIVQQGTKYSFIRVCADDKVKPEIIDRLQRAGYKAKYQAHVHGDPIFYLGKKRLIKDLPFTTDPSYIAGFIHGWWLADGYKTTPQNRRVISTTNEAAVKWLEDYASYGGYCVLGVRRTERKPGDGSFANGKPLFTVTLAPFNAYEPKVRSIAEFGVDEVFCLEEPVTKGFMLANGLLTGNCVLYVHNFDEEKSKYAFAYITQICYFAFIRRIDKEKDQGKIKDRAIEEFLHDNQTDPTVVAAAVKLLDNKRVMSGIVEPKEKPSKQGQE